MRALRAWLHRASGLVAGARREREIADEIASHLQLHIDDNLRAGMTPEEARRQAFVKFGPVEAIKDAHRDRRSLPRLRDVGRDVRYAARLLRRSPAYAAGVISTIALAVGVNVAIFSVFNAAVLRPFNVPAGDRLVTVTLRIDGNRERGVHGMASQLATPEFVAVRDHTRAFSGTLAFSPFNPSTLGAGEPRQIQTTLASCEYFDVLRIPAEIGRTFLSADCRAGAPAVVVLSDGIWRSAFGSDPQLVGRTVTINRAPFTVIGIAQRGYTGTQIVSEDAYVPFNLQRTITRDRSFFEDTNTSWLYVVGRLGDGATIAAAQADLDVVGARLGAADRSRTLHFTATRATLSGPPEIRKIVLAIGGVLVTGVALVLLIACANIANLLLARATARRREFAVRMALGAGRGRLIQQLLTESLLLSAMGGALAYATGSWATRAALAYVLAHVPASFGTMVFDSSADARVLAYAVVLTILTAVAFGLAPALQTTRMAALEYRSVATTDRPGSRRLQSTLIALQVAVCLVLLLSAALLARGLYQALTLDPGLSMDNVSVISYDLRGAGYTEAAAAAFQRRAMDSLAARPGIVGVAESSVAPLSDQHRQTRFGIGGDDRFLEFANVSPSYFDLLRIPIVRGRNFRPAEVGSEAAAIVTESTARRLWPGRDPLKEQLVVDKVPHPVVGVARDMQISRLGLTDKPFVFLPASAAADRGSVLLVGVARGGPSPAALSAAVRALDPDLAVSIGSLSDNLELWRAPSRLFCAVATLLAVLALILACTGVFGTVAYTVSRRVREIGIRVALGAAHGDVLRLIVRQGMRPVVIGMAAGAVGAAAAGNLLASMLFGVSPHDPIAFAAGSAGLFLVALVACYIPARRALNVEPTVALRTE